jgi:hypothetical protein
MRVSEVIDPRLARWHLVDPSHQPVPAEGQLAETASPDQKAVTRIEFPPGLDALARLPIGRSRWLLRLWVRRSSIAVARRRR